MDNENIEVQNKASKADEIDMLDKVRLPVSIYKAVNQLQKEKIPILFDPKNPNNSTILLKEDNTPKKINYLTHRNPAVERKKLLFLCFMFLSYLLPISVWLYYRYL